MTSKPQPQASWDPQEFPCTLNLQIPFPTPHLASIAQRVLSVDEELSPLVRRRIFIASTSNTEQQQPPSSNPSTAAQQPPQLQPSTTQTPIESQAPTAPDQHPAHPPSSEGATAADNDPRILHIHYAATTNRMLRVAVNGFISSVGVVLGAMKELDVDVVYEPVVEGMEGVQGLEVASSGG